MRVLAPLAVSLALTACSSPRDVNPQNFAKSIDTFLEQMGPRCEGSLQLPARSSDYDPELQEEKLDMLSALAKVGLLHVAEETEKVRGWRGSRDEPVRVYTLTEAAKPFVQERPRTLLTSSSTDFCWGKVLVDRIVRWQGPKVQGDYQEVMVTFTFRVVDMPAWAQDPAIQSAFPMLRDKLGESGKKEVDIVLVLSTDGWRVVKRVRLTRYWP